MNGAEAVLRTLAGAGARVCFANPGTTEMHLVQALDRVPEVRAVPVLFEGVATGAADGYARITGMPAATLLHLGPGLANGMANLHNARRAHSPVVNVVGAHATWHSWYDAPLESDIEGMARTVSGWVQTVRAARDVGPDTRDAVAAAQAAPGQVATLVLPADVAWTEGAAVASPRPQPPAAPVSDQAVAETAGVLSPGNRCALLLGGAGLHERGLMAAARIARRSGAKMLGETFPARLERGFGRPAVDLLSYLPAWAGEQLAGLSHLVLAGARSPVTFFGYQGTPSDLVPEGCEVHTLAAPGDDVPGALEALADRLGVADVAPELTDPSRPQRPTGLLDQSTFAAAVGAVLPQGAIIVDESNTSGPLVPAATAGAPPHDVLTLTGGAIGQGPPVALGAALAAPDRPVLNLESDGSAMYTLQALWSQARAGANVTTVVANNGAYAILRFELGRIGGGGERALDLLDLGRPTLDFTALARGLGVPARRVATAEELVAALERGFAEPGPVVIEAMLGRPG